MATGGSRQTIGYKYRTPLRAETLNSIVGHLATPGLVTIPSISVAGNQVKFGAFSCFLHYTEVTGILDREEQLIKAVFSDESIPPVAVNSDTRAIGIKYSYTPTGTTTPSADWYPDFEALTLAQCADYNGIIAALVLPIDSGYVVTPYGADFSSVLLSELGWNPDCWLTVKSPRSGDATFYQKLEVRTTPLIGKTRQNSQLEMAATVASPTGENVFSLYTHANLNTDILSMLPATGAFSKTFVVSVVAGAMKVTDTTAGSGNVVANISYTKDVVGKIVGYVKINNQPENLRAAALLGSAKTSTMVSPIYSSVFVDSNLEGFLFKGENGQILQTQPLDTDTPGDVRTPRWVTAFAGSVFHYNVQAAKVHDRTLPVSKEGLRVTLDGYTGDASAYHASGAADPYLNNTDKFPSITGLRNTIEGYTFDSDGYFNGNDDATGDPLKNNMKKVPTIKGLRATIKGFSFDTSAYFSVGTTDPFASDPNKIPNVAGLRKTIEGYAGNGSMYIPTNVNEGDNADPYKNDLKCYLKIHGLRATFASYSGDGTAYLADNVDAESANDPYKNTQNKLASIKGLRATLLSLQANTDVYPDSGNGATYENDTKKFVTVAGLRDTFKTTGTRVQHSGTAAPTDNSTKFITEGYLENVRPKLNNSYAYTNANTYYAPTGGGSSNQVLVSGGSGTATPVWSGEPTVTSITTTSSKKKKKHIRPFLSSALAMIRLIKIVSFVYKDQENDEEHIGFIAEDTDSLLAGKKHDKMKHAECIALLIKAVQELDQRVTRLENEAK